MKRWRLILSILATLVLAAVVGGNLAAAGGNKGGKDRTPAVTSNEAEGRGGEIEDADEPGDVEERDGAEANEPSDD